LRGAPTTLAASEDSCRHRELLDSFVGGLGRDLMRQSVSDCSTNGRMTLF